MLLPALALLLTSPDVRTGAAVPRAYVYGDCAGGNRAPRLRWSGVPRGARALALTMHDSDAPAPGGWTHWLVFRIPPSAAALGPTLPPGAVQARNDFGTPGYGGPCPPPGPAHHYVFRLDALDAALPLSAGTTYAAYEQARRGHVIASATIVPTYAR
ncbi:MAG: YbhB/YbcL family Raf kinase inhibitor-like protein [Candidatus Eremiobacteraeota bacterium]|nr:YbhB/YbcL family Raf kinase inhibitor-like protein [Candidatus Eremiobacteraeota bacterium]